MPHRRRGGTPPGEARGQGCPGPRPPHRCGAPSRTTLTVTASTGSPDMVAEGEPGTQGDRLRASPRLGALSPARAEQGGQERTNGPTAGAGGSQAWVCLRAIAVLVAIGVSVAGCSRPEADAFNWACDAVAALRSGPTRGKITKHRCRTRPARSGQGSPVKSCTRYSRSAHRGRSQRLVRPPHRGHGTGPPAVRARTTITPSRSVTSSRTRDDNPENTIPAVAYVTPARPCHS
jgi:hypothetical protein